MLKMEGWTAFTPSQCSFGLDNVCLGHNGTGKKRQKSGGRDENIEPLCGSGWDKDQGRRGMVHMRCFGDRSRCDRVNVWVKDAAEDESGRQEVRAEGQRGDLWM